MSRLCFLREKKVKKKTKSYSRRKIKIDINVVLKRDKHGKNI